jgi:nitronate monooxygenase
LAGLLELLSIHYPIIQAPMAGGVSTPLLAAAVSEAGGLGMIGVGYLNPLETREQILEVKNRTKKPFGINLFIPEKTILKDGDAREAYKALEPFRARLGVASSYSIKSEDHYKKQLQIVLEEGVPVCSFTFGLPTDEEIRMLKEKKIIIIATATTVEEAMLAEKKGMDAVVLQGSEAGGHRGTFLHSPEEGLIGLISLIPQAADQVSIPVIAAGGIMDSRGINAALCLGAEAAQLGTAFLTCKESGANSEHKRAILHATEEQTVVTKVFSGKYARGINNDFIKKMEELDAAVAPFPVQNSFTSGIRKEAAKQSNPEYMSLWSGQSPRLSKDVSVAELMAGLVSGLDHNDF